MILDATNRSLEIVLTSAKTTTDLAITADYVDEKTGALPVAGMLLSNSNGTSPVTVVAAPAASTRRNVKRLTVCNNDTAAKTLKLSINAATVLYPIFAGVTLQVGDTLFVDASGEWYATDASGQRKASMPGYALLTQINGSAGAIGEYFSSEVLSGSSISVPASTNTVTITTLNLGIGTYDVSALAATNSAGSTTTSFVAGHTDTSASSYSVPNGGGVAFDFAARPAGTNAVLSIGAKRFILSAPSTIYLRCRVDFAVSAMAVYGGLYARRVLVP